MAGSKIGKAKRKATEANSEGRNSNFAALRHDLAGVARLNAPVEKKARIRASSRR
jgi:hypothetical protein